MSYNGYLLKVGGRVFPTRFIKHDTYKITPNQRMDLASYRTTAGNLVRATVNHTATKIEFQTPPLLDNYDVEELMTLLRSAWTSEKERRVMVEYYDVETNNYKTGTFYMPDIAFQIYHIDDLMNRVYFRETRLAFIEY